MNRGFWLILAAVVLVAIGWFVWPTANQKTQAPATAQAPAATPPVQPTVKESADTASAPEAPAPAPALAPSAQVAEKESAPAKGAQTTEKPAPAPPAPAPTGAAPADTKGAAAPSPAPAPSPAAPAEEKTVASSDNDAGPHANDKASAERASLQPGIVPKDLVAALNGSVISFAYGGAEVPASMTGFLQKTAANLKQLPKGHIVEVAGYTDSTGDEALNVALSQRRAEAIREALVKFGADPEMLIAKGYGSANPIASNDTPEGRRRNRRIEYHIVKTP